jgi:Family of unknown function (DUF5990)
VHVGVQPKDKRENLLGLVAADAASATWTMDCVAVPASDGATDLKGPYIQGAPGGRFIYLNWGTIDEPGTFALFRRAKLQLDAVPPQVLKSAAEQGVLVGRLGLTDRKGNPLCASVRPPLIEWSAQPTVAP